MADHVLIDVAVSLHLHLPRVRSNWEQQGPQGVRSRLALQVLFPGLCSGGMHLPGSRLNCLGRGWGLVCAWLKETLGSVPGSVGQQLIAPHWVRGLGEAGTQKCLCRDTLHSQGRGVDTSSLG